MAQTLMTPYRIMLVGNAVLGGAISMCSGYLGYGFDSWQYWLITLPLIALVVFGSFVVVFRT